MRADARAKRAAIVAAARELVASSGGDVPLTDVAKRAGVGIGTLYRHFPDRADLLEAVVLDMRAAILALVETHVGRVAEGTWDDWADFVEELAAEEPGAIVPEVATRLVLEGRSDLVELRAGAVAALESVLSQARRLGHVGPEVTAVRFMLGMATVTRSLPMVGVPGEDASDPEFFDVDGLRRWLVQVYLRGLTPTDRE